jgi:nucleotide-binding universal stress UspA family protein
MYKNILLASDGSIDAGGALEPAIAFANHFGAELTVLVVMALPYLPILTAEVDAAKAAADIKSSYIISVAQQRANAAHVAFHADTLVGPFVERVLEFITHHPTELLILGKIGHSSILDSIFPTAVESLVRRLSCSVHLVRA